ncbi:MAG: penicillin-binding transpeptidase domain-containing protein [Pseudomonadota bacterium]
MADVPFVFTPFPGAASLLESTGFGGTIVLHHPESGRWMASHPTVASQRFIPASTFKVLSSLMVLETGIVAHADALVPWDGQDSGRPEINRNLTLREAFRLSAVPHYQSMLGELGITRVQSFIDEVGYGNRSVSGGVRQFWLNGGLRISPVEQVDFLLRLFRGDLPFSPETMAGVRSIMSAERGPEHHLHAKTGWAVTDTGLNTGWWVGRVKDSNSLWFFATVLQSREPGGQFGAARMEVTRRVLQRIGALPA